MLYLLTYPSNLVLCLNKKYDAAEVPVYDVTLTCFRWRETFGKLFVVFQWQSKEILLIWGRKTLLIPNRYAVIPHLQELIWLQVLRVQSWCVGTQPRLQVSSARHHSSHSSLPGWKGSLSQTRKAAAATEGTQPRRVLCSAHRHPWQGLQVNRLVQSTNAPAQLTFKYVHSSGDAPTITLISLLQSLAATSATQQAVVQSFLGNHSAAVDSLSAACRTKPVPYMYVLLSKALMKAQRFEVILNCNNFFYCFQILCFLHRWSADRGLCLW